MNVIELINKIKAVASSQKTCNSVFDGDVHSNWNSGEIKFASVNVDIETVTNQSNISVFSVVLYYGDRLLQDKTNINGVITDGINTLQSILNILNTIDYVDIPEQVNYIPFEEKFADYLGGVYCQVEITTDSALGLCEMDEYSEEIVDNRDITLTTNFLKQYLVNDLNWSEEDAIDTMNVYKDLYLNSYGKNTYWTGRVDAATYDNLTLSKQLLDNYDTSRTNIVNEWRDNRFLGVFFPNLDFTNVTNAERFLHSNYNTVFVPSIVLPNATNIAGIFYYDDTLCMGGIYAPAVTQVEYNRSPYYLSVFRRKVTIDLPNCTDVRFLTHSCTFYEIPTIKLSPNCTIARCLLTYGKVYGSHDILDEVGYDFKNVQYLYMAFCGMKQMDNEESVLDLRKMNLSSVINANYAFCTNNIKVILPDVWELPNAEVLQALFGWDGHEGISLVNVGKVNCPNAYEIGYMFQACPNLKRIEEIVCDSVQSVEETFVLSNNIEWIGKMTNLGCSFVSTGTTVEHTLELDEMSKLKIECIQGLFESLGTVPVEVTDATVILPPHLEGVISNETIQIATDKNWTVTFE